MLWVDDIIPIVATLSELSYLKDLNASKYEIQDMGDLQDYLGISVIRNHLARSLILSQELYS